MNTYLRIVVRWFLIQNGAMTSLTNHLPDDRQFEVVYAGYFDLLVQIAIHKFRVPDSEAETLAHDVLISYLRKSNDVIALRPWLVGAICHASRHYWRLNSRTVPTETDMELDRADPASVRILDSLPNQLAAREALECLNPRCREILAMRYFEGCTVVEVAERLGIKPKYAQKLISKCLRRAETLYGEKGKLQ
jgi:RNA polymerase sigma factor (sigma-70 family)